MANIEISSRNQFAMVYNGSEKRTLSVENSGDFEGSLTLENGLMRTGMVMHLIAPEFPNLIYTNFKLDNTNLINEMYRFYGRKIPRIVAAKDRVEFSQGGGDRQHDFKFANAHSGGLDSAYRAVNMIAKGEKVVAVHIKNLNAKANYLESRASRVQAEAWGMPYVEVVLKNGSKNTGYQSMRSRDVFLATGAIFASQNMGVKRILVEGDFVKDKTGADFSEYEGTWKMINKHLRNIGLETSVEGMDAGDIETVGSIVELEKRLGFPILAIVQNCFSAEFQKDFIVKKWQRITPVIAANSSDHWCGSCLKCRRMTLGRLYYEDPKFAEVPTGEVKYFIEDTYKWIKKYPQHNDLISKSFMRHLQGLEGRR